MLRGSKRAPRYQFIEYSKTAKKATQPSRNYYRQFQSVKVKSLTEKF